MFNLSSANAFNLIKSKILSFDKELSFNVEILTLNNPAIEGLENIARIGENADNQHFLHCWKCFLPFHRQIQIFESNFLKSNANTFNICRYKSNIFSFNIELIFFFKVMKTANITFWPHLFDKYWWKNTPLQWLDLEMIYIYFQAPFFLPSRFFAIPPWNVYRISPNKGSLSMQSIDREPLFCTQFVNKKFCLIVSAVQVFWKHCGKRRNCS